MYAKRFNTQDGAIAYWTNATDASSDITLVFLPGLTADHRLFERQIEHFKKSHACLVWDAPSHGESRPFKLNWTMDDLARYVDGILAREGIERPVIIGQSLGGYVAQSYMDLFPCKVAGFVSIDSCPLQRNYYSGWEIVALKHTHAMYASIPWNLLVKWGSKGCASTEYGRNLMRTMMNSYAKREYVDLASHGYRILAEAIESDRPYLIDAPTLLLCGTEDRAGSARRFNKEWQKQSDLSLIWVDDAGHNSNSDRPAEVNELIEGFVSQLPDSEQ